MTTATATPTRPVPAQRPLVEGRAYRRHTDPRPTPALAPVARHATNQGDALTVAIAVGGGLLLAGLILLEALLLTGA